MTQWTGNKSIIGDMRSPANAPTWKHVDSLFDDFGCKARNVQLLLSTNGMNPFSFRVYYWSTWNVIVTVLNLPPWVQGFFFPLKPSYLG